MDPISRLRVLTLNTWNRQGPWEQRLELIREERQAGFTYYSLAVDASDARWPLIELAQKSEDAHGDQARLTELLRRRGYAV